jgi:lactate dehydrogenase-like 2-hydroxyacid dehydrogenase
MHAAVLAIGGYDDADVRDLEAGFNVIFRSSFDDIQNMAIDARHAVRAVAFKGHAPFGHQEMALLPSLGVIANYGVGYDAIDTVAAKARRIAVTNTPDVLNDDVADLAVAMMLMQGRDMRRGDAWVRDGIWAGGGELPLNRKISGGRVGILGLGRIGREIAARLAAFKMDIHYWSRGPKKTPDGWQYHNSPDALAAAVDYLIVALVGGAQTHGIVSASVIKALGPKGVLINISRGSTVDEAALLEALEKGHLAGAGLDVFLNEPSVDPRFFSLENVVLQPHQGSGTIETRAAMAKLQRDNIAAFLDGQPLLTEV